LVKFSKQNPILLSGDAAGNLNVYRTYGNKRFPRSVLTILVGLDGSLDKNRDQADKLMRVMYPNGYSRLARDKGEGA
jgi:hypothetical protein